MTQADTDMQFNYIIVGAGSAGCVLANRLTENPRNRVLLLEAGGADRHPMIHIPAGFLRILDHPATSWRYRTSADEETGNREILFPRGKGLGGSSSINGLLYVRAFEEDLDAWAAQGNPGWDGRAMMSYFRRSESWQGPPSQTRGGTGPLITAPLTERPEICKTIVAAAEARGLPFREDMNASSDPCVAYYQQTRHGRRRWSANRAYLAPARKRPNLTVLTDVMVDRLELDGRRVTGVRFYQNGTERLARAGAEVILSAGVIGSPAILQRSGIGDPNALKALGIEPRAALPGVGKNMQDHYVIRTTWKLRDTLTLNERARGIRLLGEVAKYVLQGRGLLTYSAALVGIFANVLRETADHPDTQFVIAPGSFKDGRLGELEDYPGMTCGFWRMRPESRGHVRIKDRQADTAPEIQPGFLREVGDRKHAIEALRFARALCRTEPLASYVDQEMLPGADVTSDEALLAYSKSNGSTVYHGVGTCRMGSGPNDVVGADLTVRGLAGLRVADASIMPAITSTNTNATTIAIAEKAAEMIKVDDTAVA